MTFFELVRNANAPGAPLALLIRSSLGLFVYGLRHPFRPARFCRLTGKVTPR